MQGAATKFDKVVRRDVCERVTIGTRDFAEVHEDFLLGLYEKVSFEKYSSYIKEQRFLIFFIGRHRANSTTKRHIEEIICRCNVCVRKV